MDNHNRAVLIGVHQGSRSRHKRCFLWIWRLCQQDYGIFLNPEKDNPFIGVSKPVDVIIEKLGCVATK